MVDDKNVWNTSRFDRMPDITAELFFETECRRFFLNHSSPHQQAFPDTVGTGLEMDPRIYNIAKSKETEAYQEIHMFGMIWEGVR